MVSLEAIDPINLAGTPQTRLCARSELTEPVAVAPPEGSLLVRVHKLLQAILPQRLNEPIARAAVALSDQDGLVQQLPDQIGDGFARHTFPCTDELCGLELEAPGEHGELSPERPLLNRKQLEAPVDGCLQGLLSLQRGPAPGGQKAKAIVQALENLVWRQRLEPDGCELDREWDAIKALAELSDGHVVVFGQSEAELGRGRTVHEHAHCLVLDEGIRRRHRALGHW